MFFNLYKINFFLIVYEPYPNTLKTSSWAIIFVYKVNVLDEIFPFRMAIAKLLN